MKDRRSQERIRARSETKSLLCNLFRYQKHGHLMHMAEDAKVADAVTDADGDMLDGLFICEDYVVKSWQIGSIRQELLCSNMSSVRNRI